MPVKDDSRSCETAACFAILRATFVKRRFACKFVENVELLNITAEKYTTTYTYPISERYKKSTSPLESAMYMRADLKLDNETCNHAQKIQI